MTTFKHGGHLRELAEASGLEQSEILDFSANMNPLGPPEWLRAVVSSELGAVVHYPDPDCLELKRAVAARYGVEAEQILVGNGSTELIYLVPEAARKRRAVIPVPSYADYVSACERFSPVERIYLDEKNDFELDAEKLERSLRGEELVFLGHPNNPTGRPLNRDRIRELADRHPSALFVIDEAFLDLCQGIPGFVSGNPRNILVLISLTKTFAIPGLRLGCAVADSDMVAKIKRIQPPWSVSRIAQAVGKAACDDVAYVRRSRAFVAEQRARLTEGLATLPGLTVFPGEANYLLARIDRNDLNAPSLAERLLSRGIAIRMCSNFEGLDDRYFRVAVRTAEENDKLLESLRITFGIPLGRKAGPSPRAIMFQGTSSNAGKSVLTAALCRILLQDGVRVAPFKSQNMSLNSFVTRDGGEMGRAQVFQAQACRLDPDVRMNPILLKPNSDTGSQVIVNGKPVGSMDVLEYVDYKPTAFQSACRAFDSLAAESDVIVMEGAGSPAEVNLKHHDIVNMAMARYAGAPVVLVGDIDRGGVFASFVGTMEVLAEWERNLVAGFVANRFRGRPDILDDALKYTLRHTGRRVIGIVPFIRDLGLPEEDSVTFKSGFFDDTFPQGDHVEIAVVDLPHISNFTDFDAFRVEPDVRLRVVRSAGELRHPDAIILPGSKNVLGDLASIREKGLDRAIADLVNTGTTELVGVCGGFQMIGSDIADPHHIESESFGTDGLGFLQLSTVMAPEKTLTLVDAVHTASGEPVRGYEIHHGQTESRGLAPLLQRTGGEAAGVQSPDGLIWGTYLHGIFDSDGFRRWFIDRLRTRKGLAPLETVQAQYDLEPAFDRLADTVRAALDMEYIYKLLKL